jgi:DNA-directed RNA polymerase specialized sigma24 family protein
LIGAVRNYLADVHRRANATTRMPKGGISAIDDYKAKGFDVTGDESVGSSPERAFNARYVAEIIRVASERLQRELESAGDGVSWELFRLRVLHAAFQGDATGYDQIAPRLGIDKGTCAARLLTAKRRFANILMEELRATMIDPNDLRDEVADLMALLNNR